MGYEEFIPMKIRRTTLQVGPLPRALRVLAMTEDKENMRIPQAFR